MLIADKLRETQVRMRLSREQTGSDAPLAEVAVEAIENSPTSQRLAEKLSVIFANLGRSHSTTLKELQAALPMQRLSELTIKDASSLLVMVISDPDVARHADSIRFGDVLGVHPIKRRLPRSVAAQLRADVALYFDVLEGWVLMGQIVAELIEYNAAYTPSSIRSAVKEMVLLGKATCQGGRKSRTYAASSSAAIAASSSPGDMPRAAR